MTHKKTVLVASFFIMTAFLITNQGYAASSSDHSKMTVDKAVQTKSDLDITQDIRKAIVADPSLSMYAHNVKIVVEDGVVTLRGPVQSLEEREIVVNVASHVVGMKRIVDEMSVATK
jgi:osmotically-inducible protein OsmY